MAVTNGHLVIPQGRQFTAQFLLPIDLTGLEVRLRFAPRFDSGSSTLSFTSSPAAGLTITQATPTGIVDLLILPAQTLTKNANVNLLWQLEAYDPLDPLIILDMGTGTAEISPRVP